MGLRTAAIKAYQEKQREALEQNRKAYLSLCAEAERAAERSLGFCPSRVEYNDDLKRVVATFDDVQLAYSFHPQRGRAWFLLHTCPQCGKPILGTTPAVNLADIGQLLTTGPEPEATHYCLAQTEPAIHHV
jgi:hypothetical protein